MSNHTLKMIQVPIEINDNLYFSQIWYGETFFGSLHNVVSDKNFLLQIIIFE